MAPSGKRSDFEMLQATGGTTTGAGYRRLICLDHGTCPPREKFTLMGFTLDRRLDGALSHGGDSIRADFEHEAFQVLELAQGGRPIGGQNHRFVL